MPTSPASVPFFTTSLNARGLIFLDRISALHTPTQMLPPLSLLLGEH